MFARTVARYARMTSALDPSGWTRTYNMTGQLFFVTVTAFLAEFDYQEPVERAVIDLTHSQIWDGSADAAPNSRGCPARRCAALPPRHAPATVGAPHGREHAQDPVHEELGARSAAHGSDEHVTYCSAGEEAPELGVPVPDRLTGRIGGGRVSWRPMPAPRSP